MNESCARCHEVDEDRRTLWMACLYEMDELKLPFKHEVLQTHIQDNGHKFYTMRVCKDCRADWMSAIQNWFHAGKRDMPSCGSGIYIRRNGALIEITEEEWYVLHPDKEPVRFKGD
jgi:hypothetical protein